MSPRDTCTAKQRSFDSCYRFSNARWNLYLYPDSSLAVHERIIGICFECADYESVFDFLEQHHELLQSCSNNHPIYRLAEHLNYPFCMLEEWMAAGRTMPTENE